MQILWTYVLGPILALLPKKWRDALGSGEVRWKRAAMLSGLLESAVALVAIGYWYSYEMGKYASAAADAQISGRLQPVTEQQIGGVSLVVVMTHPVTWILAYFIVEGAVRLCAAAFTENAIATLPLAIVDWVVGLFGAKKERPGEALKRNAGSFAASVKERVLESRAKDVADELNYKTLGAEEFLEICASRKKEEWIAPKVVRVDGEYYRLEESFVSGGPRPFRYRLRKLAAGVPGRSVLLYSSPGAK